MDKYINWFVDNKEKILIAIGIGFIISIVAIIKGVFGL